MPDTSILNKEINIKQAPLRPRGERENLEQRTSDSTTDSELRMVRPIQHLRMNKLQPDTQPHTQPLG
jgi:hypothetical protein